MVATAGVLSFRPVSLSTAELEHIYRTLISPELFPSPEATGDGAGRPRVVLLAGQPGCGKSRMVADVRAAWDPSRDASGAVRDWTLINGDDLRAYHPDFDTLVAVDHERMPDATASATDVWVHLARSEASRRRRSVMLETTLRRPPLVLDTFAEFAAGGYLPGLEVVACHPAISRLGTMLRYWAGRQISGWGRIVPAHHHDECADGLSDHLADVMRGCDVQVFVRTRAGDRRGPFVGAAEVGAATTALHDLTGRPWSAGESAEFADQVDLVLQIAESFGAALEARRELDRLSPPNGPPVA